MGQRQAEVTLTYLAYIIDGFHRCWRFKTEPNPHVNQLMRELIAVHLFQIREIYFTLASGDFSRQQAYEISEEGMWFLGHLFTNWTEMAEKAKDHTARNSSQSQPHCSRCGQECVPGQQCAHCHHTFCKRCYDLHVFNLRMEQDQPFFQGFTFRFEHTQGTAPNIEDLLRRYKGINLGQSIPTEVREAHTLLGIPGDKPTEEEIRKAFRSKVKALHPDSGGQGGDLDKLTKAKERALKFIGVEL